MEYIDIATIAVLHDWYGCAGPGHPLVTVIDLKTVDRSRLQREDTLFRLGLYAVFLKQTKGSIRYGQSTYDFDKGTLMCTSPNQVVYVGPEASAEGWGLFFHPDLVRGKKMSHISLLLDYADRFYDRQFYTRAPMNNDLVQRFERLLAENIHNGLPDVQTLAGQMHLSPGYLSDVLKKHTGKTAQEHIHLCLVDKAKTLLWSTDRSVSEIGFEHPSHFTKLFKAKTGQPPSAFRKAN